MQKLIYDWQLLNCEVFLYISRQASMHFCGCMYDMIYDSWFQLLGFSVIVN